VTAGGSSRGRYSRMERSSRSAALTGWSISAAAGGKSGDGGHWRDIVVDDLGIAGDAVGERGVIALDDFLHKEWPDVTRGFFDWHRGPGADFAPLAISPNKLYLVRKESFGVYAEQLFAIPSLRSRILKYYNFLGQRVPILSQRYPYFVLALKNRLEQASPRLYERLLAFKRGRF
jgi:hypothetical protein